MEFCHYGKVGTLIYISIGKLYSTSYNFPSNIHFDVFVINLGVHVPIQEGKLCLENLVVTIFN